MKSQELKTRKTREELGWRDGTVTEFLGLTPDEEALIEIRLALGDLLREKRKSKRITQAALSKQLSTDQARIAKAEKANESVSLDFIIRAVLATGASAKDIGQVLVKVG